MWNGGGVGTRNSQWQRPTLAHPLTCCEARQPPVALLFDITESPTRKMGSRTKLANLPYNSPIRLYSEANIKEVLNKQVEVLSSGAVGVDFHKLSRPGNLANSEVLRMVEQQEQSPGLKRVAWPPPEEKARASPVQNNHPEPELPESHPPFQYNQQPQPASPFQARQPHHFQPQSPQPFQTTSFAAPQPYQNQTQGLTSQAPATGPKGTVTLLATAPVRQESAPIFLSQPVAGVAMGGNRMRGDTKWPPESVRQQSEAENAARIALARGPVFRPKRPNKDYSSFFAQHALNSTYPGYKPPPGTQHFIEEGTSNL